jgi:SAM-dependent methyltransferase
MSKYASDFENTIEFTENCRRVLEKKKSLRHLYGKFYSRISEEIIPGGKTLEIGSGPGFLKEHIKDLVTSDTLRLPWIDRVFSANSIPFEPETFHNIVMIYVLHHLNNIPEAIREMSRVLKPGGRLVILDHQLGFLSFLFMKFLHHEYFNPRDKDIGSAALNTKYSNTAIPYAIIQKDTAVWRDAGLTLKKLKYHTLFSYLLSCGFKPVNLLPDCLIRPVNRFDELIVDNRRGLSLLMTAVFEKEAAIARY